MDNFSHLILQEIYKHFEDRLELIGEVLEGKIAERTANYPIYDRGEFYRKLSHSVSKQPEEFRLTFWSNTPHAKFVLGGKVPSNTPIKPLKQWVLRKKLSWLDKKGNKLTADQMAYMIQSKIRRKGIKERNVLMETIKEELSWIESQLQL